MSEEEKAEIHRGRVRVRFFFINRAAHTTSHRLSADFGEKANQVYGSEIQCPQCEVRGSDGQISKRKPQCVNHASHMANRQSTIVNRQSPHGRTIRCSNHPSQIANHKFPTPHHRIAHRLAFCVILRRSIWPQALRRGGRRGFRRRLLTFHAGPIRTGSVNASLARPTNLN
jgi:hypothetical protein